MHARQRAKATNAGTWLIGRLQTERDKARVLEGLEGASAGQGGSFDRQAMERTLAGLAKRHFYVHDVHAEGDVVIESRWTMSYLRGPLTRDEIKKLSRGRTNAAPTPEGAAGTAVMPARAAEAAEAGAPGERPLLPAGVPEVYFPTTVPRPVYRPMLLGSARVHFEDARTGLDFTREVMFVTPVVDAPVPMRWEDAKWAGWAGADVRALGQEPAPGATFLPLPSPMATAKNYDKWSKELAAWLARTQGVARLKAPGTKTFSRPNEDERSFRARLAQASREERDRKMADIRAKFAAKLEALEERIRRAREAVARERAEAQQHRLQSGFDIGGAMLGALLGGGARRAAAGAASAAKSANRAAKQAKDVEREQENLDALLAKHAELQREANAAIARVAGETDPATMPLESIVTKPKKAGISVHLVALAWRADDPGFAPR